MWAMMYLKVTSFGSEKYNLIFPKKQYDVQISCLKLFSVKHLKTTDETY